MSEELNAYEEIRKRIENRYKQRAENVKDIAIILGINILVWFMWLRTDPNARMSEWILWVIAVISIFALGEKLLNFMMGELQERAVRREIEREREHQLRLSGKLKRDDMHLVRLSDDGELLDLHEYDDTNAKIKYT